MGRRHMHTVRQHLRVTLLPFPARVMWKYPTLQPAKLRSSWRYGSWLRRPHTSNAPHRHETWHRCGPHDVCRHCDARGVKLSSGHEEHTEVAQNAEPTMKSHAPVEEHEERSRSTETRIALLAKLGITRTRSWLCRLRRSRLRHLLRCQQENVPNWVSLRQAAHVKFWVMLSWTKYPYHRKRNNRMLNRSRV